jgi:hypothetical protein
MPVPNSLLVDLQVVPRDRPTVLLMRHSNRFPITDQALNYTVGLTEEGFLLAAELGILISARFSPGRILSSPVGRCVDTANAIARGAGWSLQAQPHLYLSHDHIQPAWERFIAGQINGHLPTEVLQTLDLLLDHPRALPALDILVTHDTVVGAMVGCLLHQPVQEKHWPAFLEGAFFWKDQDEIRVLWRGAAYTIKPQ